MKQVSKKRAKKNREYDKIRREVYERSDGRCEINATWSCSGMCEEVHHKQGRIGDRMLDMEKMAGICRNCHDFINSNPALAYDRGWMLRRNV